MAQDHIGLLFKIAMELTRHNERFTVNDVIGDGYFGLLRACKKFDESRGFSLSTFAAPCIRGAILDSMRNNTELGLNRRTHQISVANAKAKALLWQKFEREPTDEELSDFTKCPKWLLIQRERRTMEQQSFSLEAIPSWNEPGFDARQKYEDECDVEERFNRLANALKKLRPMEQLVIHEHYFNGMSYTKIARSVGVSGSRISQVANAAITKLRVLLSDMEMAA